MSIQSPAHNETDSFGVKKWREAINRLVMGTIRSDGSIVPKAMSDSVAKNNSIYYSTTASKLVYKDSTGTVNNLY